jgi:hypothetical protein
MIWTKGASLTRALAPRQRPAAMQIRSAGAARRCVCHIVSRRRQRDDHVEPKTFTERQARAIAKMLSLTESGLIAHFGGIDKLPREDREMCDAVRSAIGMGPLHGRVPPAE